MISRASKIGYASGNLGKSVLWSTLDLFFLFILTELWGVPPVEAGLIVMIALIFDGLAAPLMGILADRTPPRYGKYGPYLALGAPLCAASFWLLLQPAGSGHSGVTILFLSLLFRGCYTICDVPHNALLARICREPSDASSISGIRFFFSSLGAIIVSAGAGWVLWAPTEQTQSARLGEFALLASGLYVATIWWAWRATARLDSALPNTAARVPLSRALALILSNRMLMILFALAFIHCLSVPLLLKGIAYFAKYVRGDAAWSGPALLTIKILQAFSMPVWIWFSGMADKRRVMAVAYVLFCVGLIGLLGAYRGSDAALHLVFALIGVALGGLGMGLWAFLPDAIDAGGSEFGETVEALPTGLFLMIIKCSTGIGAGLFGLALNRIGLIDAGPDNERFGDLLVLVIFGGAGGGALICAMLTRWVDRKEMTEDAQKQQQRHLT